MLHKSVFGVVLLALIALNISMTAVAIARYPAFFQQYLALMYVLELAGMLFVYAAGAVYIARASGALWSTVRKNATVFAFVTAALELINLGIENASPAAASNPILSIGSMLIVFMLWGIAAVWTIRSGNSIRAGILTAVVSAGFCMLIAVAAGFAVELFVLPPAPALISTWAEFKRSGWTDAHAFGLANTLDSGFTHLLFAPIVALIFGGAGSLLSRCMPPKKSLNQSTF
ncbi:MAG TPA: hypothetical protein VGE85_06400 [Terracidiphilus sp.]